MKFKVINERTKEVVGSGLAIHGAREVARKYNVTEKVDYFYIKEQKEVDKPYRAEFISSVKRVAHNGEEVSSVIKREIKQFLTKLIKKHPNDTSLGAAIRESYK